MQPCKLAFLRHKTKASIEQLFLVCARVCIYACLFVRYKLRHAKKSRPERQTARAIEEGHPKCEAATTEPHRRVRKRSNASRNAMNTFRRDDKSMIKL